MYVYVVRITFNDIIAALANNYNTRFAVRARRRQHPPIGQVDGETYHCRTAALLSRSKHVTKERKENEKLKTRKKCKVKNSEKKKLKNSIYRKRKLKN